MDKFAPVVRGYSIDGVICFDSFFVSFRFGAPIEFGDDSRLRRHTKDFRNRPRFSYNTILETIPKTCGHSAYQEGSFVYVLYT